MTNLFVSVCLNSDEGGGLLGHVAIIPRHHDQLEIEK